MVTLYTTDLTEALEDRDFLKWRLGRWLPAGVRRQLEEALREVEETIQTLEKEQAA